MLISRKTLAQWVDLPDGDLTDLFNGVGLEVESVQPVAEAFSGVVVGEVLCVSPHPDADRLRVTTVDVGQASPLTIVTNLSDVAVGWRLPVACLGAKLPDGMEIKPTKLRGVESMGMFCGASTLSLSTDTKMMLFFPNDAQVGQSVRDYLQLDDECIDLSITPNRGDCLSYLGISRQLAAKLKVSHKDFTVPEYVAGKAPVPDVKVMVPQHCPVLSFLRIDQVNAQAPTPLWLIESLRRCGLRSVSVVVDCLNWVMLQCGQPMHAYDLDKLGSTLSVRMARPGETMICLDGRELTLNEQDMVIADDTGVQDLAGMMGAASSAVTEQTSSVLLEAGYFSAELIAGSVRRHQIVSDAAHRFERGVDWQLPRRAIAAAADLIVACAGGELGASDHHNAEESLPSRERITLRSKRCQQILGFAVPSALINDLLPRLGMQAVESTTSGWTCQPPSFRPDITSEIDLIEEVLIAYGVSDVPVMPPVGEWVVNQSMPASTRAQGALLNTQMAALGYQETIQYSFIDPTMQQRFCLDGSMLTLANPISSALSVMRGSLLPGLLQAVAHNARHQIARVKLFERGRVFSGQSAAPNEQMHLAAVWSGAREPVGWANERVMVDFYDMQSDVRHVLAALNHSFNALPLTTDDGWWHPGQALGLYNSAQERIGCVAALHPRLQLELDLKSLVMLFELNLERLDKRTKRTFENFSKFPSVSRELSLLAKDTVTAGQIIEKILEFSGSLLHNIEVVDVYDGSGISPGKKSLSLQMVFKAMDRTLLEPEVQSLVDQIVTSLETEFDVKLRA